MATQAAAEGLEREMRGEQRHFAAEADLLQLFERVDCLPEPAVGFDLGEADLPRVGPAVPGVIHQQQGRDTGETRNFRAGRCIGAEL
mgnify:CR=1 FL=1